MSNCDAICIDYSLQIESKIEYETGRNQCLTPLQQLLSALRFYATGTFQLVVGDLSSRDKSGQSGNTMQGQINLRSTDQ